MVIIKAVIYSGPVAGSCGYGDEFAGSGATELFTVI
jgi:hypothetical protein